MNSLREIIEWLLVLEHLLTKEEDESFLERLTNKTRNTTRA